MYLSIVVTCCWHRLVAPRLFYDECMSTSLSRIGRGLNFSNNYMTQWVKLKLFINLQNKIEYLQLKRCFDRILMYSAGEYIHTYIGTITENDLMWTAMRLLQLLQVIDPHKSYKAWDYELTVFEVLCEKCSYLYRKWCD